MKSALICTLYNGELEFPLMCEKINLQINVKISHHVISGLNEYAAHVELVKVINSRKYDYDFIVKIDADSILTHDNCLFRVFSLISESGAQGATLKMFDYFSESLIGGMNFFTPYVKFVKPIHFLYPDRIDIPNGKILKGEATSHLEPIADHCRYPSKKQSYFYGYRRALKKQDEIIKLVVKSFLINNDEARAWAIIGMKDSQKFGRNLRKYFFSSGQVDNFFDKRIKNNLNVFEEAKAYAIELNEKS
jgi:hypothetical protein